MHHSPTIFSNKSVYISFLAKYQSSHTINEHIYKVLGDLLRENPKIGERKREVDSNCDPCAMQWYEV